MGSTMVDEPSMEIKETTQREEQTMIEIKTKIKIELETIKSGEHASKIEEKQHQEALARECETKKIEQEAKVRSPQGKRTRFRSRSRRRGTEPWWLSKKDVKRSWN